MSEAISSPRSLQQDLEPPNGRRAPLVRANPLRPALAGFGVIVLFVAAVVLWGLFAPVSGAATAEGVLQVEGRRQSVQHPYGGVVKDLLVREGDQVGKGQILLTLSDTEPRSRLDVLLAEGGALLAEEARLMAEREGRPEPAFGTALTDRQGEAGIAQAMANERAVMRARTRQFESETGLLRQRIGQLQEQKRGSQAQLDGLKRQGDLIEEEAKGARYLLASGLTPKTRVLSLEREAARLLGDQGARLSDIASTDEAIGAAKLEIAKLERARTTEVTNALRTAQSRLAELAPKIDAARDVLTRTRITAPATGAVVGLSIFTQGGVIQQGARLLDIVPRSNPLMVEAKLRLADIHEVVPGRHADIRLTNFVRNERPVINGEVVTVSADRLTDERSGQGYYSVLVRMNPDDLERSKVELQAGMPAQVVVTTRPRTLVDYLIAPLLDQISGAFHEK
ncbi:HlyD family type I secretion periplasmic adaptor subunit [Methylobacterium sp. J-090]|uniref:HlyD family type I secretion periplasmic adaptor subunit n=1 Tax=Methylobacterium sp. J-090 TaxID=2836666 RepID=UPI001FBA7675|nr:HlyD family type I secretion periplasmic adaptor subunit [Methylobacterium sp. J-090]MCJ2084139.1 HlyD family type I secretion periplasmic adaptor subunit [Methylobacterium sp. J-090]